MALPRMTRFAPNFAAFRPCATPPGRRRRPIGRNPTAEAKPAEERVLLDFDEPFVEFDRIELEDAGGLGASLRVLHHQARESGRERVGSPAGPAMALVR